MTAATTRDPRTDPWPGDVLAFLDSRGKVKVRSLHDGIIGIIRNRCCFCVSRETWVEDAAGATIIRRGDAE
jgi:hypothetical protein